MTELNVTLHDNIVRSEVEPMAGLKVEFSAARVHNRSSGYHASTRLTLNGKLLAADLLNFEKHAQRKTLANDAHAMLPEKLRESYPKLFIKRDLDEFCEAIWETYNSQFKAELVAGDPDSNTDWFCQPMIMQEAATILYGKRGGGKSVTAVACAVSIQQNVADLWFPIEKANVLYINIERGKKSMARRVARVNTALGLSAYEPLLMVNARGKSLDHIYDQARRSMRANDVQVVFFDSISRAGVGDLNENQPANQVMDMLSDLTPTWMAVAHMTEQEGGKSKVFGSQMYENAADVVIKLDSDRQGDTLGVGMEIVKANDTRLGQEKYFKYEFDGDHGLAAITPSSLKEFPDLDNKSLSAADEIELFIDNAPLNRATSSEIAQGLNRDQSNVSKILARQTHRFYKFPKNGREQPYGLVSRLGAEEGM